MDDFLNIVLVRCKAKNSKEPSLASTVDGLLFLYPHYLDNLSRFWRKYYFWNAPSMITLRLQSRNTLQVDQFSFYHAKLVQVSFGATLVMGCTTACPVLNTVFSENNSNKYCCDRDFCNSPSNVPQPNNVIQVLVTTTSSIINYTTTGQSILKCKFGSSGSNSATIICPSSLYFCGVSFFSSFLIWNKFEIPL